MNQRPLAGYTATMLADLPEILSASIRAECEARGWLDCAGARDLGAALAARAALRPAAERRATEAARGARAQP